MLSSHDSNSDALENGHLEIAIFNVDFDEDSGFQLDRNLQCILTGVVGCKKQLPGLSRISQQPDLIESLVISKTLKYSPGLLLRYHNFLH